MFARSWQAGLPNSHDVAVQTPLKRRTQEGDMAEIDTAMPKQEMKGLLMKSKKQPVNCSFGQGAEPHVALLMLDRLKSGRTLETSLLKKFPDAKSVRFGTAFVDLDDDPRLVKFLINRPVSGAARKLAKTLRGTGFTKVVILLEDGTPVETFSEETEAAKSAAVPEAPPQFDAASLRLALVGMIGRIGAVTDPVRRASLASLANEASTTLKAGDLASAKFDIDQLHGALDVRPSVPPAAAEQANSPLTTYAKSRLAWLAARKKVESDIETLRLQLHAEFAEDDIGAELDSAYDRFVAPVLAKLDESLADKLDEVINTADPVSRLKMIDEAKAIIQRYQDYLAGASTIDALDANPVAPLAIRQTLSVTLTTLAKTVH
jgi:hypothetical protein